MMEFMKYVVDIEFAIAFVLMFFVHAGFEKRDSESAEWIKEVSKTLLKYVSFFLYFVLFSISLIVSYSIFNYDIIFKVI